MRASLACAIVAILAAAAPPAHARVHFNQQLQMTPAHAFADIDGDGLDEWAVIQPSGSDGYDYLSIYKTDYLHTLILQSTTFGHASHLFTGRFLGGERDLACYVGSIDNQLTCQAAQLPSGALAYVVSQPSFLAAEDFVYAGDFTGDGRDDLLVLQKSTGRFQLFSIKDAGVFGFVPDFDPTRLPTVDPRTTSTIWTDVRYGNKQIFVGNFSDSDATGRRVDDVLVIQRGEADHTARVYAAIPSSGYTGCTFNRSFESGFNLFVSKSQLAVGEIDGDGLDEIVANSELGGQSSIRFYRLVGDAQIGLQLLDTPLHQLEQPAGTPNRVYLGTFQSFADGAPGAKRDDFMFRYGVSTLIARVDARWWAGAPAYWWAFTSYLP